MHQAIIATRRELMALGAAGLTAAHWPAIAADAGTVGPIGYVHDTRFAATAAPRAAAWTWAIDGDVTALWTERLDRAWRDPQSGLLAGTTGDDALFVLEHLAWDRQRRVVERTTVPDAGGPVPLVRWFIAPRARRA